MASRYRGVIKIKTMKDKTISASLIYRKIEGKLSAVEEERFEAWLKEGWEHREYYERMRRMYQQENVQEVVTGELQEVWGVFEKRVQGQRRSLPKLVLRSAPKSSRMRRSGRISDFM